jgi:putative membrane protein
MKTLEIILIALVAIEHVYILYLEMFLWTTPKGMKAFGLKSQTFAEETQTLAANQGLYNGFLAAGLFWSLYTKDTSVSLFFIICVCVAALYGAYSTKSNRILIIQGTPAFLALIVILIRMFLNM